MKIRTKLVLLLCAALVVTTIVSTYLQVIWTRDALEDQASDQARADAVDTAKDLQAHITSDSDADEISDLLKEEVRRHRAVASMEFTFNSDENTTVSVDLRAIDAEANVKSTARPPKRKPAVRRDEIRRALSEHGESSRPPGDRTVEPLWRTPDRSDSPLWARLSLTVPPPKPQPKGPFLVESQDEQHRQGRFFETSVPVVGARRGQLTVRVSLEIIDRLARIEKVVSAGVTGSAVLILILVTAFIANRIVGRPVAELAGAMRGVEGGDLSRRVLARSSDEIGKLGGGFNAMLERLSAADEEIRAFNRRLAEEVRAATADLARKNDALGQLNRLLMETRRELGDKERLAALGQLAAQLAHELGTPLASVSGHLQLAMTTREISPALKERLQKAARELERISKIVRDYLDSTRPIKPARIDTDLARLVDEAVGIARGAGERPDLYIDRKVNEDATHLETDPGLLRQILVNLVTNAIDAVGGREGTVAGAGPGTGTGPGPRAGGGHIAVGAEAEGGMVAIRVRDDGVGIAAEDAARIFEPFYTTKGRGKGTGLGLAICRELATALGGRITVESQPGVGSTFTVRLPLGRGPVAGITHHPSGRIN